MKISIITVSFNSESTIKDTIISVLNQTYSDLEYIVVDGNSIDNTVSIIKEYEPLFHGRMKWISEPDNGLYDAMNKGIKIATGDIIGILNSDDFYHNTNIIKIIANEFLLNSGIDAIYGDVRFVSPLNLNKTVRYYSAKNFNPGKFKYGFMPPHPSFFCYKRFFDDYGYYKTDYKIAADYELLIRFLYLKNITCKYLPLDFMKMRTGGISTSNLKSNYILNKEIIRSCKENGIYTNMCILMFKYFVKVWELILINK